MCSHLTQNVTLLLNQWKQGNKQALDNLVPLIYRELKKLAKSQLGKDGSATIQCTELVAEAYIKLVDADNIDWQSRAHFLSVAARTMRRVLVERFRKRKADKRGGGQTLLTYKEDSTEGSAQAIDLEALENVLLQMEKLDPRQAEIVTLKFFGGLEGTEIADTLSISISTVKREWQAARMWLFRALNSSS